MSSISKTVTKKLEDGNDHLSYEKFCDLIIPTIESSYKNATSKFKAEAAIGLCEMACIIGADQTTKKVLPILTTLLDDDNSKIEVKENVTSGLLKIAKVSGESFLND
jgi:hypothetical protein